MFVVYIRLFRCIHFHIRASKTTANSFETRSLRKMVFGKRINQMIAFAIVIYWKFQPGASRQPLAIESGIAAHQNDAH